MAIQADLLKIIFSLTEYGTLTIKTPEDETLVFSGSKKGAKATVKFKTWKVLDALASHKDAGLFEAFAENMWDADSLENLCDFMFQNEKAFRVVDENYVMGKLGLMNSLTLWSQSSKVTFTEKKPISDYEFTFDYKLHPETKKDRVLLLGKNNGHLKDLKNITIFKHKTEYEPFDSVLIYDPFFYVKDADIFLKKMSELLKPGGKMRWRTFIFEEELLTQSTFISKLVFPGYWAPYHKTLAAKSEGLFTIEGHEHVDYPKIEHSERLVVIFNAIVQAMTQNKKLDYKELVLVRK